MPGYYSNPYDWYRGVTQRGVGRGRGLPRYDPQSMAATAELARFVAANQLRKWGGSAAKAAGLGAIGAGAIAAGSKRGSSSRIPKTIGKRFRGSSSALKRVGLPPPSDTAIPKSTMYGQYNNSNYVPMKRKRKKRKRKRAPAFSKRRLKVIKKLIAKPDWSRAIYSVNQDTTVLENAVNTVAYHNLIDNKIGEYETYDEVFNMLNGTHTSLNYSTLDGSGAEPVVVKHDMIDSTRVQKHIHKKIRTRFDVNFQLKNVGNGITKLKFYLVRVCNPDGVTESVIDQMDALYQQKVQDDTADQTIDFWQDSVNLLKKGAMDYKFVRKLAEVDLNAGESSNFSCHVPWQVFDMDKIVNLLQGSEDYMKGQYQILCRQQGELTHSEASTATSGYTASAVVVGFKYTAYASFLEQSDLNIAVKNIDPMQTMTAPQSTDVAAPGRSDTKL